MNGHQPPRVATWLLCHFGCSAQTDTVIGDLAEQYQRGRSRLWYWWQVAVAIIEGFIISVRIHKLVVFRALLIGMAFQLLFWYSIHFMLRMVPYQYFWAHPYVLPRIDIWIIAIACALNGRILGWLHRPQGRTVAFAFAAFQFITMFVPLELVRSRISWVFQLGGGVNILMWNSSGMTALNNICATCANPAAYEVLLLIVSYFVTAALLLFGSGVLRNGTSTPGGTYDRPTTT